ncbi:MAG: geranylgeranylglycerol-phosphate geranylgeranyltransferase [Candidatus Pseudobacter hemicellulosilyticus]|uniref:Geranylgeranylglycerol-phosphate geranylgeranyltransferase n=1 Tax=Candidatus Pseudobacter hemicellulosilyticus TaxID=3121375 RepID=A0AAJ6BEB8_9BACT|nr:MAG: geranylgeranylglycerol-phosphate geranylgeranyltransferase [Pseudobacter sp.]
MKLLAAFFKLVRTLNLLFIVLTQLLFYYCIAVPVFQQAGTAVPLSLSQFMLLMLASVLIAAGGYIINDYFDLNIDRVNKPTKMVVEKLISRRWAIVWHMGLSILGILLSFYVAWKTGAWWLAPVNTACVIALWFYSTTFKKKILSGNIIISLLTAWVVLVVGFLVHFQASLYYSAFAGVNLSKLLRLTFLYGSFAFIISLIREVIKDIEDMQGDERYGCRTMPIVWGVQAAKLFIATWLVVLIAALLIVQAYVLPYQWWWSALYCLALVIIPLIRILRKLFPAISPGQFHELSTWVKLVMFTGILSMVFFKIYA